MAKVVKVIELMSESSKSWEDAAQNAIKEASKTLRNIRSISFGARAKNASRIITSSDAATETR